MNWFYRCSMGFYPALHKNKTSPRFPGGGGYAPLGRGGSLGRGGEEGLLRLFTSITEEEVARTLFPWGALLAPLEDGGILKEPTILAFPSLFSSSLFLFFSHAGDPGMREERKAEEASFPAAHNTVAPTRRITRNQMERTAHAIYLRPPSFAKDKEEGSRSKEGYRRKGDYERHLSSRKGQRRGDHYRPDGVLGRVQKVQGVLDGLKALRGRVGKGGSKEREEEVAPFAGFSCVKV